MTDHTCRSISFCSSSSLYAAGRCAAASSDAAADPNPERAPQGGPGSPARPSASDTPGWNLKPRRTEARGSPCPARCRCCSGDRSCMSLICERRFKSEQSFDASSPAVAQGLVGRQGEDGVNRGSILLLPFQQNHSQFWTLHARHLRPATHYERNHVL